MRVFISILISLILTWMGYQSVFSSQPMLIDFSAVIEISYLRVLSLYVAMLLGILTQAIYSISQADSSEYFSLEVIKKAFKTKGFVIAILVSPIIFFTVYNLSKDQPDNVVAFCLAFQNGYFWRSILQKQGK